MTSRATRICTVAGCGGAHDAKGLCNKHYLAQRNVGQCSVAACRKRIVAKGLCNMHYGRLRTSGSLGPSHSLLTSNVGRTCAVPDCNRDAKCKGFCRSHMGRFVSRRLSYDSYDGLLQSQGGACAICGRTDVTLVIDHDHTHCDRPNGCNECVRGLLCGTCNTGLGKFNDDPAMLLKALTYLSEKRG